jgi:DUF1680 family protein
LQGRLALQRGPIVYCLEGVDHEGIILDRIAIDPKQVLSHDFEIEQRIDLLGGVSVLRGTARVLDDQGWGDKLYRYREPSSQAMRITAVPYDVWDNRTPGEMRVWLRAIL